MGWATAIQGAIGLGTAFLGKKQSDKATNAQVNANQQALALQQQMWQQQQQNLAPFMQYGQGAGGLGGLASLMGGDYSGFMNSPDFKARVQFANEKFNDASAARFRLFSGGAQNDRDELNQNLAAQGLGDYRNALMWGANLGQNAAAGVGQAGQNYANAAGNLYGNIGNAQATGYGNTAGFYTGLGGLLGNLAGGMGSSSSYGVSSQPMMSNMSPPPPSSSSILGWS